MRDHKNNRIEDELVLYFFFILIINCTLFISEKNQIVLEKKITHIFYNRFSGVRIEFTILYTNLNNFTRLGTITQKKDIVFKFFFLTKQFGLSKF